MKEFQIQIKTETGELSFAKVLLEFLTQPNSQLTLSLMDGRTFQAIAGDGFHALRKIRQETERLGITLLIQGCRPNCWPSGMSASMSNGTKIYARELNRNENGNWRLVNTFDPAHESEIGTLSDQDDFNNKMRELFK